MKSKVYIILLLAFTTLVSANCKKKNDEPIVVDDFNKSDLLTNVANNIIIPQYLTFQAELNQLSIDYSTFISSQASSDLTTVQNQLITTYLAWQNAKTFELGPAMNIGLRASIGSFPTDTSKVTANIQSGSYNLGTIDNASAVGLSVIEFMLFRQNEMSYFGDNGYKQYGTDVLQKMTTEISQVLSQWQGNYSSTFIASTGTESTSSFSRLVNEFNLDYELVKNAKLGIPIGKQSLGILRPEYIEARRSGISLQLIEAGIKQSQRLFNGNKLDGSSGIGFDDYLIALEKTALANSINAKYNQIFAAKNAVSGTLEHNMESNIGGLDNLYLKMAELVIMTKTDMPSAFGVLITYQDNDGD